MIRINRSTVGAALTSRTCPNLERDFPNLRIIRLEQNYRSTPEILSTADCLIRNNEFRKEKVLVPSRESGRPVHLCIYPTARQEAEDIADRIAAFTHNGDYSLRDVAILYRTNAQSRLVEQALLRRQMPYQLIGGYRFFLRKEIKDLVSYLLLINNPSDDVALVRAINAPPRGIGKKTIESIAQLAANRRISMLDACRVAVRSGSIAKRASTPWQFPRTLRSTLQRLARIVAPVDAVGYRQDAVP